MTELYKLCNNQLVSAQADLPVVDPEKDFGYCNFSFGGQVDFLFTKCEQYRVIDILEPFI